MQWDDILKVCKMREGLLELPENLYVALEHWLITRPLLYPKTVELNFSDDFKPTHLDCYGTARRVAQEFSWPVIAGVQFLDKAGKLFSWPHMVNNQTAYLSCDLIDASPLPDQKKLGFLPIRLNETKAWMRLLRRMQLLHLKTPMVRLGGVIGRICLRQNTSTHFLNALTFLKPRPTR